MACDVSTASFFVDTNSQFQDEKPYELQYQPRGDFPLTNLNWAKYENINVADIRGHESQFTISKNGFQLCRFKSSLTADHFRETEKIEQIYLKEVAHFLKEELKADRVLVFDYNRRMTVPGFPLSSGEPVAYQTPATVVHIDTTPEWTEYMHSSYSGAIDGLKGRQHYQYVNLWKPIRGPVKRWPLMLCDWSTYDPKSDVIARDLVYTDGDIETFMGYYNPKHRYHYVSNQREDEAWIFVQCDSINGKGVLHTAFESPLTTSSDAERESIEVRCMAYYND